MEREVVEQIGDDQWALMMPEQVTRRPMAHFEVVRYHVWDSAWIPEAWPARPSRRSATGTSTC
jgi:hypothetical protein